MFRNKKEIIYKLANKYNLPLKKVKEIVDYKVLTDDVKYSVSGIWNDDKYVKVHGDQVPGR